MRSALLCAALLWCVSVVAAQEKQTTESETQNSQLPAPGTWVKFLLSQEGSDGAGTLTVKMIDEESESNGRYRRVEFDWLIELPGDRQRVVTQYLLSEKSLLTATTPFDSVKQIRTVTLNGSRLDDGPILESEVKNQEVDGETKANLNSFGWEFLFPGPRRMQKVNQEKREVEYQRGKLTCTQMLEVQRATDLSKLVANNKNIGKYLRQDDFRIWLHPQVPFGIAHFEQRRSDTAYDQQGEILGIDPSPVITYTLNDFGTDAKSALPANP